MDKDTYLNVGLALIAGAAGYAAYAAWTRPSSNVVMQKRLKTSSGTGTTDIPKTKPNLAGEVYASLKLPPKKTPSTPTSSNTATLPSSSGTGSSGSGSSKPVVVKNRITKKSNNGVLRPGPKWGAYSTTVRPLTSANGVEFVNVVRELLHKRWRKNLKISDESHNALARALVRVALEERFPLDLLLGWAWREGMWLEQNTANGAGAIGPLQMTPIAFADVGMSYPGDNTLERVRAGVRHFKKIRASYPECASSLTATFRVYGMGWGGYRAFKAACHNGVVTRTSDSSVWKLEMGALASSYTGVIFTQAQRPLLHTMDWGAL